ncbi:MAG: hypothetical protein QNJ26_08585 [Desulfobacterales bacterium]|nr:hypothetical protein [Desulfobacterales bacterium]
MMDTRTLTANRMSVRIVFIFAQAVLILVVLCSGWLKNVRADDTNVGDTVTIVTPGIEARLCPQPACGPNQHLTRIPEGSVFTILSTDVFAIGTFKVKWFEVIYENQRGWISIYDTDRAQK